LYYDGRWSLADGRRIVGRWPLAEGSDDWLSLEEMLDGIGFKIV
jgi:hypothetical protein